MTSSPSPSAPEPAAWPVPLAPSRPRLASMAALQLLVGALITAFLFFAVYLPRRDWSGYAAYALRGDSVVLDWLDQGYLRRAGLLFGFDGVRGPTEIHLQGDHPNVVYT